MDVFLSILRAAFALAIVLGLVLGLAYGLRRYAPQLLARFQAQRGERRMNVVETLVLDPARRLVLVRIDDEERLLLLGEGQELIEPRQRPAPKPQPAPPATVNRPVL
ncbi:flagellar biosynthetic protein FliO [Asticcacaulis sp. AND118]|uniref:flagellar biosynthetic protein FliO n=1 Tax=Asticcacaulis sp. AND118 TaxID=2840468 RepID=UPI001CFFF1D7|nr:flagellar biosynthetic protein FliO [Asticcacaulis sp. AND118]UDF02717.1 flagellar biosynthetic protein FliO [Asticcacaulis sp. AND118]